MSDIYSMVSKISYILAALLLLTAIILFFVLKIKKVVCDLSGRTAKKSIEHMRWNVEKNRNRVYDFSFDTDKKIKTSKITEQIPNNGVKTEQLTNSEREINNQHKTDILFENNVTKSGYETMVLGTNNGTTILDEEELDNNYLIITKEITLIYTNEKI